MSYENFEKFKIHKGKNILSVDYGTKVTGLASFYPGRDPFPTPFGRIIYKDDLSLIKSIKEIIDEEFFDVIVIGFPLLLDGQETEMTKKAKLFGELVRTEIKEVEVYLQDETLTTYAAQDRMKNSPQYNFKVDPQKIDEVAATIILEDFMRS